MAVVPSTPEPASVPARKPNFLQRIAGVLWSPAAAFAEIVSRPDFLIALLLIAALAFVASFLISPHMDMETSLRGQLEQRGGLTEAEIDRAVGIALKMRRLNSTLASLATPAIILIVAGVYTLALQLFGGDATFRQILSVTVYAWMPVAVQSILRTAVILPRGMMSPEEILRVLKSNPGAFLDPSASPALKTILSSLDLFYIWTLILLILGYTVASKLTRKTVATIVVSVWLVVVLAITAFAALNA